MNNSLNKSFNTVAGARVRGFPRRQTSAQGVIDAVFPVFLLVTRARSGEKNAVVGPSAAALSEVALEGVLDSGDAVIHGALALPRFGEDARARGALGALFGDAARNLPLLAFFGVVEELDARDVVGRERVQPNFRKSGIQFEEGRCAKAAARTLPRTLVRVGGDGAIEAAVTEFVHIGTHNGRLGVAQNLQAEVAFFGGGGGGSKGHFARWILKKLFFKLFVQIVPWMV